MLHEAVDTCSELVLVVDFGLELRLRFENETLDADPVLVLALQLGALVFLLPFVVHENDTHEQVQEEKGAEENEKHEVERVVGRAVLLTETVVYIFEALGHVLHHRPALERGHYEERQKSLKHVIEVRVEEYETIAGCLARCPRHLVELDSSRRGAHSELTHEERDA